MSETVASAVFVDNSISCHMCHMVSVFQSVPQLRYLNAVTSSALPPWYFSPDIEKKTPVTVTRKGESKVKAMLREQQHLCLKNI